MLLRKPSSLCINANVRMPDARDILTSNHQPIVSSSMYACCRFPIKTRDSRCQSYGWMSHASCSPPISTTTSGCPKTNHVCARFPSCAFRSMPFADAHQNSKGCAPKVQNMGRGGKKGEIKRQFRENFDRFSSSHTFIERNHQKGISCSIMSLVP